MSHDILVRNHNALPAGPDELFTGSASGGNRPEATPAQRIHRMLKGRYGLAIVLALIGGIAGGVIGYLTQERTMRSQGLVEISPVVHSVLTDERSIPDFNRFITSQPNIIMSSRVIQKAAETDAWKETNLGVEEGMDRLGGAVVANYIRGSQHIQIEFSDPDPKVAKQGVMAVIMAYQQLFNETNGKRLKDDLEQLQQQISALSLETKRLENEILTLSEQHGTQDLSVLHNELLREQVQNARELRNAEFQLKLVQAALSNNSDEELPTLTPEQIARQLGDQTMLNYINQRDQLMMQLENLKLSLGEQHRDVTALQKRIDLTNRFINTYADEWRAQYVPPVTDGQIVLAPNEITVRALQQKVDVLKAKLEEQTKVTDEIGRQRHDIEERQTRIEQARTDLERFQELYDEKLAQATSSGFLTVREWFTKPTIKSDARKKMAVAGFMGGGMLFLAPLLLFGLLDGRYRYSDETKADMSNMRLLGILPNLPDRLSDPEQAQTAAHCVHQIRTMLQIANPSDQHVYAVTSAAPGDGKTSLTLALGLSFAASGSRTLLIDCDLVGAGLTARLDMTGPEGVLEAMTNRSLLDYVRSTDIADLSILPVGLAQAHHAGLFSPAALSRLIGEARKHFEVVLIDTGPILGSIEATPVASAADAVILCVSRRQQRMLVEKAMAHLQQIGSRFAGVVFNKAEAGDFAASISGMSLRSIARQHRHAGNGHSNGHGRDGGTSKAFGPVARAVATSFRSEDEPS